MSLHQVRQNAVKFSRLIDFLLNVPLFILTFDNTSEIASVILYTEESPLPPWGVVCKAKVWTSRKYSNFGRHLARPPGYYETHFPRNTMVIVGDLPQVGIINSQLHADLAQKGVSVVNIMNYNSESKRLM